MLLDSRLDHIAHYGTKGMKWGVRRAVRKLGPSGKAAGKKVGGIIKKETKRQVTMTPEGKAAAKKAAQKVKAAGKKIKDADQKAGAKMNELDAKGVEAGKRIRGTLKQKISNMASTPEGRDVLIGGGIVAAAIVAKVATNRINASMSKAASSAMTNNLDLVGVLSQMPAGVSYKHNI